MTRHFLRFCVVGGVGFGIDAGVLSFLISVGFDFYSARVISFMIAVTFTWTGNRKFTFRAENCMIARHAKWTKYLLAMMVGGGANYSVYALLIWYLTLFQEIPWLAVAAGTGCGVVVNFLLARRIMNSSNF